MALTPEQIDGLRARMEDIAQPIIDWLLADMAERVAEAGKMTSTAAYEAYRAQALGASRRELKKSRRVTCKLPYNVEESGCVCGEAPAPCPSKWQQFVEEVKQAAATGGYKIGTGLVVDEETNTLSVDTAKAVEEDNTKPVTSAAVYTQLGNVEALLHSI